MPGVLSIIVSNVVGSVYMCMHVGCLSMSEWINLGPVTLSWLEEEIQSYLLNQLITCIVSNTSCIIPVADTSVLLSVINQT